MYVMRVNPGKEYYWKLINYFDYKKEKCIGKEIILMMAWDKCFIIVKIWIINAMLDHCNRTNDFGLSSDIYFDYKLVIRMWYWYRVGGRIHVWKVSFLL